MSELTEKLESQRVDVRRLRIGRGRVSRVFLDGELEPEEHSTSSVGCRDVLLPGTRSDEMVSSERREERREGERNDATHGANFDSESRKLSLFFW